MTVARKIFALLSERRPAIRPWAEAADIDLKA